MMDRSEVERCVEGLLEKWQESRGERRHLVIGVGGGTASGKSTLAAAVAQRLESLAVEVVGQDRFFKPAADLPPYVSPTRQEPWPDYNRPDSLCTEEMFAHCRSLGGMDVVILEGILALYYPELRELMDVKCYVAADADERIVRRIRRNLKAGMDLDDICDYYLESVRFQHDRFNAPTEAYADLVIPGGMADAEVREEMVEGFCRAIERRFDLSG
jgi:uridine kinase